MTDKKPSQATIMTTLALDTGSVFFHTPEYREYVAVRVDGHVETMALKGQAARRWLASLYRQAQGGQVPGAQALADALTALQGHAVHEGAQEDVFVRIAGHEGSIYIDLADPDWRALKVNADGWEVIGVPPVYFRRTRGMLALPEPRPGAIESLRPFLNVEGIDDFRLVATVLASYLFPTGPFIVLIVNGEQGSAKSFMTRLLRELVDPSSASLRTLPRDERDLAIAASNGWIMNFDNVSKLWAWQSDALCRLSTGSGFATRELYTDDDEAIFAAARPVILNGISSFVTRGDLADRSLTVTLPQVPDSRRKVDGDILAEFMRLRPYLFGGLLDLVVEAMKNEGDVHIDRLPRMATFAVRGYAMAPVLGWSGDDFLVAYRERVREGGRSVVEDSMIAPLIIDLMEDVPEWVGTATELLGELTGRASDTVKRAKDFPKAANSLKNEIKRLIPALRPEIEIEFDRTARRRLITIRKVSEDIVTTVTPSQSDTDEAESGDDPPVSTTETVTPIVTETMPGFVSETGADDDGDDGDDPFPTFSNGHRPPSTNERRCGICGLGLSVVAVGDKCGRCAARGVTA